MSLSKSAPPTFTSSRQLIPGDAVNGINNQLYSTQSLTAATTQTQAAAIANALINAAAVKLTVGNANDGVALPLGYPGLEVFIANPAGNDATVYGSGIDTINDVATATGVTQAASKSAIYKCVVGPVVVNNTVTVGAKWYRNLSA